MAIDDDAERELYERYVARTERNLKIHEGEEGDRRSRITIIGLLSASFFTVEAYVLARNFFPEAMQTVERLISSYLK